MPWSEYSAMEERLRFVARLIEGEGMMDLWREFGISRKTGCKIFNRYQEEGIAALTDRSRRPVRCANQLPRQIETLIVRSKKNRPHWGARNGRHWYPLTVGRAIERIMPGRRGRTASANACTSRSKRKPPGRPA